ncbi:hypothetical protein QF037_009510 [Streptomyces canus]|nr:hypothetical protein [Streptomyces canus]
MPKADCPLEAGRTTESASPQAVADSVDGCGMTARMPRRRR